MAGGRVTESGGFSFKRATVGDNTLQDAVYGTEVVIYTRLSTAASGCENDMIDTTNGGTRGVTPTRMTDFRGYPRPELTMGYSEEDTDTAPCAFGQNFYATPTLKYSVGFNIKITVSVTETPYVPPAIPDAADNVYHDVVFNFAAGNTTTTEGKTLLNSEAVSASQDVFISCEPTVENYISAAWVTGKLYYIDAIPTTATLEWTAAGTYGTLTGIKASLSSITCSTDTSTFKLANSETGIIYYRPAGTFGNGDKCYYTSACSPLTPALNRWYSYTTQLDGTPEYWWEVYNGDGSVRNYTTCP